LFVPNILLATASLAGLAALGVIPSRGNRRNAGSGRLEGQKLIAKKSIEMLRPNKSFKAKLSCDYPALKAGRTIWGLAGDVFQK